MDGFIDLTSYSLTGEFNLFYEMWFNSGWETNNAANDCYFVKTDNSFNLYRKTNGLKISYNNCESDVALTGTVPTFTPMSWRNIAINFKSASGQKSIEIFIDFTSYLSYNFSASCAFTSIGINKIIFNQITNPICTGLRKNLKFYYTNILNNYLNIEVLRYLNYV
jgi:hypothetical protein